MAITVHSILSTLAVCFQFSAGQNIFLTSESTMARDQALSKLKYMASFPFLDSNPNQADHGDSPLGYLSWLVSLRQYSTYHEHIWKLHSS